MRLSFHYTTSCLSYHVCPIRSYGAPSPLGEGCDTGIPSSKQTAHHPCEPIHSPSTVIPSAAEGSLLHCLHMHTCTLTQTTPCAAFFAFPSLTIYRSARKIPPLRGSILRLRRGPFGLTGRRLNGQARRLFGLGQTRKSLCGTSVSKGLLVSLL